MEQFNMTMRKYRKTSRMVDVNWCQPALTVRVKHLAGSNPAPMSERGRSYLLR